MKKLVKIFAITVLSGIMMSSSVFAAPVQVEGISGPHTDTPVSTPQYNINLHYEDFSTPKPALTYLGTVLPEFQKVISNGNGTFLWSNSEYIKISTMDGKTTGIQLMSDLAPTVQLGKDIANKQCKALMEFYFGKGDSQAAYEAFNKVMYKNQYVTFKGKNGLVMKGSKGYEGNFVTITGTVKKPVNKKPKQYKDFKTPQDAVAYFGSNTPGWHLSNFNSEISANADGGDGLTVYVGENSIAEVMFYYNWEGFQNKPYREKQMKQVLKFYFGDKEVDAAYKAINAELNGGKSIDFKGSNGLELNGYLTYDYYVIVIKKSK